MELPPPGLCLAGPELRKGIGARARPVFGRKGCAHGAGQTGMLQQVWSRCLSRMRGRRVQAVTSRRVERQRYHCVLTMRPSSRRRSLNASAAGRDATTRLWGHSPCADNLLATRGPHEHWAMPQGRDTSATHQGDRSSPRRASTGSGGARANTQSRSFADAEVREPVGTERPQSTSAPVVRGLLGSSARGSQDSGLAFVGSNSGFVHIRAPLGYRGSREGDPQGWFNYYAFEAELTAGEDGMALVKVPSLDLLVRLPERLLWPNVATPQDRDSIIARGAGLGAIAVPGGGAPANASNALGEALPLGARCELDWPAIDTPDARAEEGGGAEGYQEGHSPRQLWRRPPGQERSSSRDPRPPTARAASGWSPPRSTRAVGGSRSVHGGRSLGEIAVHDVGRGCGA